MDGKQFYFPFKLPSDGLALRSVAIVDGVPELRFDASPKVPTILQEDVAAMFRLVAEGERPGFFYDLPPSAHPSSNDRYLMNYSPSWLRWTAVGELLAESDWSMKCVHIGARSNESKDIFKSWQGTSQLEGLATHLDFPEDDTVGPTMMSCESAKVQKGENELVFPEEPKMQITDNCNSLYSKYITQIYPSVAYYDEPKFLKMQELIKLILAVEWLYNEKGVRVSQEWMTKHTSKPKAGGRAIAAAHSGLPHLSEGQKPPYDMIPQPTSIERPSSDVSVKTREAVMYKGLQTKFGVERRFGFIQDDDIVTFKEDGTLCPPQKCLKLHVQYQQAIDVMPTELSSIKAISWQTIPFPKDLHNESVLKHKFAQQVAESKDKALMTLLPELPDTSTKVTHSISDREGCIEMKMTNKYQPHPALPAMNNTTVITAILDTKKLQSYKPPNMQIPPELLIRGVKSWDELIKEWTVPVPRVWYEPFTGIGEPIARGGVTTQSFRVKEEPLRREVDREETQRRGNYARKGPLLTVRAEHFRAQGTIQRLGRDSAELARVCAYFSEKWVEEKGPPPQVAFVYKVTNTALERKWDSYGRKLRVKTVEQYFHGTRLACEITQSDHLCNKGECGICGISDAGPVIEEQCIATSGSAGLDEGSISDPSKGRFGFGFYLAPNSSKSHDYTQMNGTYRAMLVCDVHPGKKFQFQRNKEYLKRPPRGYDSVYGKVGEDLKYPELVVYDKAAVMPRYIIVYRK